MGVFEREDEEFKELRSFIQETRERLFAKNDFQKEQGSFNLIIRIESELEKVHHEHSSLKTISHAPKHHFNSLRLKNPFIIPVFISLILIKTSFYLFSRHLFQWRL